MLTVVAALTASLVLTSLAHAQTIGAPPPPPPSIYAPFVWNGNALDQKILDAQAQMRPHRPHHRVLHRGRHR